VKVLWFAAAAALLAVPGAAAGGSAQLRLVGYGPAVVSPNGNGVNDVLRLRVRAAPGAELGLRAYAWGGRLHGWRRVRTGVSASAVGGETTLRWTPALRDGSYLVTVCDKNAGALLRPVIPPAQQRPGAAEATVSRPPWLREGCLARPRIVRVERLAAFVDSARSYEPGSRPPLVVSADLGRSSVELQQDCSGRRYPGRALPQRIASGLYHYAVTDPAGDEFLAPVVVRNAGFPLDRPPPHTALLVWPYLTWRAYNGYDANLDGRPDSWYQFWRQRRVSLRGPLLSGGREDDFLAAAPFSRWLCSRPARV
jgi:hypothetical protein